MAKKEKLTPEEEARLPAFREEWMQKGLALTTDRELGETSVDKMYADVGEGVL